MKGAKESLSSRRRFYSQASCFPLLQVTKRLGKWLELKVRPHSGSGMKAPWGMQVWGMLNFIVGLL